MTADDAFVVHFRMRSGAVGVLQSTSGDWGPPIVIDPGRRVDGDGVDRGGRRHGARWPTRDGTRTLPVPDGPPHRDRPSPARRPGHHRLRAHDLPRHGLRSLHPPGRGAPLPHRGPARRRPAPTAATFVDGVRDMAVLDAIRRSAAEGATVTVDDGLPRPGR